jgi:chromosome segregation ATPase
MDVDARDSDDQCGLVSIQEQALDQPDVTPAADPWSGWAKLVDLQAAAPAGDKVEVEVELEVDPEPDPGLDVADLEPAVEPEVRSLSGDLAAAAVQLAAELADARLGRAAADEARRDAEAHLHEAELEAARGGAELTAARARIGELERDRDEVIRRAEELLTAVRERADQRLAAELEEARRQWSELLSEERRRVEAVLDERAALVQRADDAWLAAAVLRGARPLRLRSSQPATPAEAEEDVVQALDEYETDPSFAAASPEVALEIEHLRQRLRGRRNKPADIDTVEDGVDKLRNSRLARDAEGKGRRRK